MSALVGRRGVWFEMWLSFAKRWLVRNLGWAEREGRPKMNYFLMCSWAGILQVVGFSSHSPHHRQSWIRLLHHSFTASQRLSNINNISTLRKQCVLLSSRSSRPMAGGRGNPTSPPEHTFSTSLQRFTSSSSTNSFQSTTLAS